MLHQLHVQLVVSLKLPPTYAQPVMPPAPHVREQSIIALPAQQASTISLTSATQTAQ